MGLDNWVLDKAVSDKERLVEASIYLKYPELETLKDLLPSERKRRTSQVLNDRFRELTNLIFVSDYSLLGTKKWPRGIKVALTLDTLKEISKSGVICYIFINKVNAAKKKRTRRPQSFYCIKMTAAIEIEGIKKGLQTFEERFVLIKATSQDDAYRKIEKQKESYVEPYLNSDGRQVRWRIERIDDCYETGIDKLSDFNNPEGVEVYSKLKNRRLTPNRSWDGK